MRCNCVPCTIIWWKYCKSDGYSISDASLLEIGCIDESSEKKTEKHFAVIKNAMGDVVALTTPEGELAGTYEYDPYGCILSEKNG